ncbi:MAG: cyclic nucleotide-binding domain-containing protein [Leptothrix ochracea]
MNYENLMHVVQSLNTEDAFRIRIDHFQWRTLANYISPQDFRAGDHLILEGDRDRTVYFLEQGSVQLYPGVSNPGGRVMVLRPGAVLGEIGLFRDGPQVVNAEAMTPVVAWALRLPRFEEMVLRAPALAVEVMRAAGGVVVARARASLHRQGSSGPSMTVY